MLLMFEQESPVTRQVVIDDVSAAIDPELKKILTDSGYYEQTLGVMAEAALGGREVSALSAAVRAGAWAIVGESLRDSYEGPLLSGSDVELLGELVSTGDRFATLA